MITVTPEPDVNWGAIPWRTSPIEEYRYVVDNMTQRPVMIDGGTLHLREELLRCRQENYAYHTEIRRLKQKIHALEKK